MKIFLLFPFLWFILSSKAQKTVSDSVLLTDSVSKAKMMVKRDSAEKALMAKMTYPLIKSSKYSGVIPISGIEEKPDVNQRFRILYEITNGIKDSTEAKTLNGVLAEVGRQVNLHVAAGIPPKNIDIVVIAHGGVLESFFTDSVYQKEYKVKNPNDTLLTELRTAGVKFIACGQAMNFMNIKKQEIFPWLKVALSAQTVITDYQEKGYVFRRLNSSDK